jgi:hypothetical protein
MTMRMKTWLGAMALVLGAAGACNGHVTAGGSETNWLGDCGSDDDCSVGHCVCGVCSEQCDADNPCPHALDTCAGRGSVGFDRFCGFSPAGTSGICAKGCGDHTECAKGFTCETGVCVPAAKTGDDAGAPSAGGASGGGGARTNTQPVPSAQGTLGDPCITQDEANPLFSGFAETEVNVESGSPSCSTGVCLVANFRGRVSCPYGQPDDGKIVNGLPEVDPAQQRCQTTGPNPVPVQVPVRPQLVARSPEDAVYCSCRCDGPDPTAAYCACPSGFECTKLVDDYGSAGGDSVAGSYCIKSGTAVIDVTQVPQAACNAALPSPRPIGCGPL